MPSAAVKTIHSDWGAACNASDMMALFSLAQAFFWQYVFKNYHRPVNIEAMTSVQLLNCTPYSRLSSDEWQSWIQHPGIWRIRSFELCISGSLASANQIQPQHWLTFQISNTRAFYWLDLKKDGTYHIIKVLLSGVLNEPYQKIKEIQAIYWSSLTNAILGRARLCHESSWL